ncbi:lactate racemase domain-containing protein [Nakamurella lactea]|uniref:lactate racemase domain-containing protein n=1 Tax=Nakamurella lactea TaxID=459515 RepID=UPI00048BFE99|nr:lactate racemase domain-containing protein [Nakamurella lactea]
MTTITDTGDPTDLAVRLGGPTGQLTEAEVTEFVAGQLAGHDLDGRSVCVLVPDGTRNCPMPLLLRAVHGALYGRASRITVLVALGTHAAMSEQALAVHLGYRAGHLQDSYPGTTVINHEWWKPETFADLGTISAARIAELSEGRMSAEVQVLLNRAVVEHDVALVLGPVLPHEVVGISGGNKYFFPGVAGQKIIDVSHWLGALITSAEIIGTTGITPVRALINDGAALIPAEKIAFCVVTAESDSTDSDAEISADDDAGIGGHRIAAAGTEAGRAPAGSATRSSGLHSVSFGSTLSSWADAAQVCAATHVQYLDRPVRRVLSIVPEMYDEIWTGAKGFYKVEPIVADGGEVILYAPHITEIASSHPQIHDVGYHCRDYFVKQWDRFSGVHWGVLAHSTHLRGAGSYDPATGQETLRVDVTLATGIPEQECHSVNLGYLDPAGIDIAAYEADPETLVVHRAGEVLYRLR